MSSTNNTAQDAVSSTKPPAVAPKGRFLNNPIVKNVLPFVSTSEVIVEQERANSFQIRSSAEAQDVLQLHVYSLSMSLRPDYSLAARA